MKVRSEVSLLVQDANLNLLVSSKILEAVEGQQNLPFFLIWRSLSRKTKCQSVEINNVFGSHQSFSNVLDSFLIWLLRTFRVEKCILLRSRGGRLWIKKRFLSSSHSNWMNPRLKNKIFLLPNLKKLYTRNKFLKVSDCVHIIYILKFSGYMVHTSSNPYLYSMLDATIILNTGFG